MWNKLKYLPFDWRKRKDYCIPKGPNVEGARRVVIPVAGSKLSIKPPTHSPYRRHVSQRRLLPGRDALASKPSRTHGGAELATQHWGFNIPLARDWAFWGPWMSGVKAELMMTVSVIGRLEDFVFPDVSFFNPRAFEIVLLRYLNDRYGHVRWEGRLSHLPLYRGPLDWQTHDHLPVFSASCKVYRQDMDGQTLFRPKHLFFFPITDQHFVEICFIQELYALENGKPTFDTSPIQELQDAILDSITLELSPEAQAAYDKVKAECPDMKLSDHFPPLKWPTGPSQSDEADQQLHSEQLKRLSS